MKLKIELDMDNDAFCDPNEVGRILRKFADLQDDDLMLMDNSIPLRDINGNAVGFATVTN